MTKQEALEEYHRLHAIVKNWRAKDAWHEAVYDRCDILFDFVFASNYREFYHNDDPGPWEMPPIPEGIEP